MQKNWTIWRASNPIVFICSYFLIGLLSFQATSQLWPKFNNTSLLCIVICSSILLGVHIELNKTHKALQVLPTLLVIIWGACIAQYQENNRFLSALTQSDWIIIARKYMYAKIDQAFLDTDSNAFAKSLLFGQKSNMTKSLQAAYRELGILHIIAISGMHLDILFKSLERLSWWLPFTKWASWLKLIALLILVWTYTCIAEASPSIVRASLFFSTVLIGRFFHLNLSAFNTIGAGILLVFLYNCHILSSIGLQLSYAAVIGIHFFYQPIANVNQMDNTILKFAWDNLAMSIAAQLTTTPIILYYFHTSSSLSIIGNFIFVPVSSLLLYALLAFIVLPDWIGIQMVFANAISYYINKMNEYILLLFQWLQVQERQYNLGIAGLTYYYFLLFMGFYWLENKTPSSFLWILLGTCIYSSIKLFSH